MQSIQKIENESTPNKIYFNMLLNNTTSSNLPVIFSEDLSTFILPEKPSNYEMSIIRYLIPMFDVPFFNFIAGSQKITLSYLTYSFTQDILFISRDTSGSTNIYEMTNYTEMINNAIVLAYNGLDALYLAGTGLHLPTTDKPYIIFDKNTYKFSFYATQTYYQDTVVNPIILSINRELFTKLQGLDIYFTNTLNKEVNILFHNNYDNISAGIIKNEQQSLNFPNLTDFTGLEIQTNIPVQMEYIKSGQGSQVVADFIALNPTEQDFHNPIIFNPSVPFRQSQIATDGQFNSIMFRVYRVNINGDKILLQMPPQSNASLKVMFQLKRTGKY